MSTQTPKAPEIDSKDSPAGSIAYDTPTAVAEAPLRNKAAPARPPGELFAAAWLTGLGDLFVYDPKPEPGRELKHKPLDTCEEATWLPMICACYFCGTPETIRAKAMTLEQTAHMPSLSTVEREALCSAASRLKFIAWRIENAEKELADEGWTWGERNGQRVLEDSGRKDELTSNRRTSLVSLLVAQICSEHAGEVRRTKEMRAIIRDALELFFPPEVLSDKTLNDLIKTFTDNSPTN